MKSKSWKLPLIITTIIVSIILMLVFGFQGVQNKAISLEEQISTAQSEIKIQEKRRVDLILKQAECVEHYDKHEYKTIMAAVEAREMNSDMAVEEVQTMISAVAEAYPQLESSQNYNDLMKELATTENMISNVRSNYNTWVSKYNIHINKFPNKQILNMLGYVTTEYQKLDFDVSEDAPEKLFSE